MRSKPLIFALIVIVLGLLAISIPYYLDARIPRATAVIQVHPLTLMARSYMESEFESPLSPEVLESAAQEIISISPDNEANLQNLKAISSVTPRRGTDFIEITVKHQDREFAVLTANTLAKTYAKRRTEGEQQRAAAAFEALDEELQLQAEMVSGFEAEMMEDYEQSRDMLREMKVKQQEARIRLKMPKTPITIHQRAK